MLIFHWLSFRSFLRRPKAAPHEVEIEQLKKNLLAAAANASSLGVNAKLNGDAVSPLLEMLEVVRIELGKIDSSAALLQETAAIGKAGRQRMRSPRKKQVQEPAAVKIARRLLARGLNISDAARKTLLPESVVRKLAEPPHTEKPPKKPVAEPARRAFSAPVIERVQLLL